jgi:hypothetical protein
MAIAPFQLNITMTATNKEAMKRKLQDIVNEFDKPYGKPCQGIHSQYQVETKLVTPIWDGKEY